MKKIHISGIGSSLVDYLYTNIDFSSPIFTSFMSKKSSDGGLVPGALVFTDDLEQFTGKKLEEIILGVNGSLHPSFVNLGGPGVVPLIHAAQMLPDTVSVDFIGACGHDTPGKELLSFIRRTPLSIDHYKIGSGDTPRTVVLSDPSFNNGKGERTFVNTMGVAADLVPNDIPDSFYQSDICVFGGTALTPGIHDSLTSLLGRAKAEKALTIVNTVYDFRSEVLHPGEPWTLGDKKSSYSLMDILITDKEEALCISGCNSVEQAMEHFVSGGIKTVIITHGSEPVKVYADGSIFKKTDYKMFPVSQQINTLLSEGAGAEGDTTGCGDNFVGGFLASLAEQLNDLRYGVPEVEKALAWGNASGGWACFYKGGTYFEENPGDKRRLIQPIADAYRKQVEML